jgi:hypothetical protein
MRSAVGGMKALRTSISLHHAESHVRIELLARPRRPPERRACSAGSKALSRPPAQAQSAGVHIRSPGCGRNSCGIWKPGIWPSSTRWPCSAPFGGPVVPEVDHHCRIVRTVVIGGDKMRRGRAAQGLQNRRIRPVAIDQHMAFRSGSCWRIAASFLMAETVGDDGHGTRIAQPVFERLDTEQQRQRQGDAAKLVDRTCAIAVSKLCGKRSRRGRRA